MTDLNRISNAPVNTDINVNNNIKNDQDNTIQKNLPNELQNARPSTMSKLGRIMLGIVTLGISEAIRAIVNHASKGNVSEPRIEQNAIENIGVQEHKPKLVTGTTILNEIKSGNPKIDNAYKTAVEEAYKEVQKNFPDYKGSTFEDLLCTDKYLTQAQYLSLILVDHNQTSKKLSPEEFKQSITELMMQNIKTSAIEEKTRSLLSEVPGADKLSDKQLTQFARNVQSIAKGTDIATQLENASNPDELKEAVDKFTNQIKNSLEIRVARPKKEKEAIEKGAELLAEKLGMSKEDVLPILSGSKFSQKIETQGTLIATGKIKCLDMKEYQAQLDKATNDYVDKIAAMYDEVKGLDIGEDTRKKLALYLVAVPSILSPNAHVFSECAKVVESILPNLTELKNLLRNKADVKTILYEALKVIHLPFEAHVNNPDSPLSNEWHGTKNGERYGADEKGVVYHILGQILADKDPELKELIKSYEDIDSVMSEIMFNEQKETKPDDDAPKDVQNEYKNRVVTGHPLLMKFIEVSQRY